MDHRPMLQKTLEEIKGVTNVYFNPTVNTKMEYPCIKYSQSPRSAEFANDKRYIVHEAYTIIFITRDPTKAYEVLEQLEAIPFINSDTKYVADGLHHYVYSKTY